MLLTGKYAHKNGMVANDLRLRESEVTLAKLLKAQGYQTGLQGLGALATAAGTQQGQAQMQNDAAYQQWMQSMTLPMQAVSQLAALEAMAPVPSTTTSVGTGTQTVPGPSFLSQIGGILGGIGAIGKGFGIGAAKGGLIKKAHGGLAVVPKPKTLRRPATGLALAA